MLAVQGQPIMGVLTIGFLERETRFERATACLEGRSSTTELLPRVAAPEAQRSISIAHDLGTDLQGRSRRYDCRQETPVGYCYLSGSQDQAGSLSRPARSYW